MGRYSRQGKWDRLKREQRYGRWVNREIQIEGTDWLDGRGRFRSEENKFRQLSKDVPTGIGWSFAHKETFGRP